MSIEDENAVDDAIAAALAAGRDEDWVALWDAVDALAELTTFATWEGRDVVRTTIVDSEVKDVYKMPYPRYAEPVDRIREHLGALGLFVPFGWPDWDGLPRYRDQPDGLISAPVADAVRMLVAIHRSERFSDGSIDSALRRGVMQAALARLRRWYDRERRPDRPLA